MTLTANENAVKILAMLKDVTKADPLERADFLDAVKNLCEQVKDFPFPKEPGSHVPGRFPG